VKRAQLENETNCRFVLVELGGDIAIKHLIAVTDLGPHGSGLPQARHLSPGLLWHPQEGSSMNVFLEKWAIKAAGGLPSDQGPSISAFWEEYNSRIIEVGNTEGTELLGNSDAGLLPAGGATLDMEDLIMEGAAKVSEPGYR